MEINHYPQVKNKKNLELAIANTKKYGLFTFDRGLIGEWAIISIQKLSSDKFKVLYMNEKELGGNLFDGVAGHYFINVNNVLLSDKDDQVKVLTNKGNFIKAFVDTLGMNFDTETTLKYL